MAKFTDGEWHVERLSGWGDYCVLEAHNEQIPDEEDRANAALIAAAPLMYEALKTLRAVAQTISNLHHQDMGILPEDWSRLYQAAQEAKAALAAADGKVQ